MPDGNDAQPFKLAELRFKPFAERRIFRGITQKNLMLVLMYTTKRVLTAILRLSDGAKEPRPCGSGKSTDSAAFLVICLSNTCLTN